jgi:PIN domain nuclease of toxin-antitoxin system
VTRLLLDTNVVVWLLLGERDSISAPAVEALTNEDNAISLSAVSVWEIAIKRSLGKLQIAREWPQALAQLDFDPLPVSSLHAHQVEHLPWHHRDPFDRLLVAQATVEGHALITADPQLDRYGVDVIW